MPQLGLWLRLLNRRVITVLECPIFLLTPLARVNCMRLKLPQVLRDAIEFDGFVDPLVLDACERGVNIGYWVVFTLAMPLALWLHLIVDYKLVGWVYVVVPLAYLPVALGWFPSSQVARVYIAVVAVSLLALSINAIYAWTAQPGMFLLMPGVLVAYIMHGGRALLIVTGLQSLVILLTSASLGIPTGRTSLLGILTALALWFAVVAGAAVILRQALLSSRLRAQELETLSDRLYDSEARLRENEQCVRHILTQGLDDLETTLSAIEAGESSSVEAHELVRLRTQMQTLRHAVVPPEGRGA